MKKLLLIFTFIAFSAQAEEYTCTYTWEGKSEAHPILIDVQGEKAIIKGSLLTPEYVVVSNTNTELLLYRAFTKANSGSDYPVGFTVMAFDKKTKYFSRSNTFAHSESNNHAFGKCGEIK